MQQEIPQEPVASTNTEQQEQQREGNELSSSPCFTLSTGVPEDFRHPQHTLPPQEIYTQTRGGLRSFDDSLLWRAVLLLVVWLYAVYQLPYRACDLMLRYLSAIATPLGLFPSGYKPIITLNSALRRLELEDPLHALPMCPTCRRVFPATDDIDIVCQACSCPIFDQCNSVSSASKDPKPFVKLPYNPLSRQLAVVLNQRGMEEAIEEWRSRERNSDVMHDIMDGEVWRTVPGPDGKPFFDNGHNRRSEELRIGITIGFDG